MEFQLVGIQDLILTPILLLVVWFWGKNYAARKYGNSELAHFFTRGLYLRMLGGLAIAGIYAFMFKGGDSIIYFKRSTIVSGFFTNDPIRNWVVFWPEFFQTEILNIPYFPSELLEKSNSYLIVRLCGFVNLFLFRSYFAISLVFSLWGFMGSWKLFQVFYDYKPAVAPKAAIFCLYLPSLLLWGSGVLKDAVSFGGLGILVYCVYHIFIKGEYRPRYFVYGFICLYIVGVAKAYILLALMPSLVFFVLNQYGSRIGSQTLRIFLFPIIMLLIAGIGFGMLNALSSTFTSYNLDNLNDKMEGFQRWHTIRSEQTDGSAYTIPDGNIIVKVLASVNVTFFRPYLWESKKPIVAIAAVESLYILWFTLTTIRKAGARVFFVSIMTDPMISFCFIFSFAFAFAVGSTSYNFGALSRFKIPCLPFYLATLSLALVKKQEEEAAAAKGFITG